MLVPHRSARSAGPRVVRTALHLRHDFGNEIALLLLDARSDLVPGIWVIQIWQGDQKLTEQPFKVILPPIS